MEQLLEKTLVSDIDYDSCHIVVKNDDHNSFEHVIECFIKILKHSEQQAEQLAMMIHTKGAARVKHGSFEELQPPTELLINEGLDADIE